MMAAEAHAELKALHASSKKRRLPATSKRALEYAMAMIAEKIGNEVLDRAAEDRPEQLDITRILNTDVRADGSVVPRAPSPPPMTSDPSGL